MQEIYPGIDAVDLGLFIRKPGILVISDTQIGYDESLNRQGYLIPRNSLKDQIERLGNMIKLCNPEKIIIDGDLKHDFAGIMRSEWDGVLKLLDFISSRGEAIIVKGNHDNILEPILKKRDIRILDHYFSDGLYICHGHKIPEDEEFKKSKLIIIGHEHPAVSLKDNERSEKYKCFLKGKFQKKDIIVLPSFNLMTEGTDILSERLLSPLLAKNLMDFEVFIAGQEMMNFGKVNKLLTMR